MFEKILVVCIGNICRSPMAEALLKNALPAEKHTVTSAGLGALAGHAADDKAQQLMKAQGIDISAHEGRQINSHLIRQSDLILVMDDEQQKAIEAKEPSARGKVYRLGHWGPNGGFNVPDPYRKDMQEFENGLKLIEKGVADWKTNLG